MAKITIGQLLDTGLIKRSTKVALVTPDELKSAGLIKLAKTEQVVLVTKEELDKKGLIK
jgi:hypothetical protein